MIPHNDTYDAIERYLLGQMTDDERAAFETRLAEDASLAEQLARQQREHTAMQLLVEDHLRAKLINWKTRYPLRESFLHRFRIPIAGALLLLLLGVLWQVMLPKTTDTSPDNLETPQSPARQPISPPPAQDTAAVAPETPPSATTPLHIAVAVDFNESVQYPVATMRSHDDVANSLDSALLDLAARRFSRALARLDAVPRDHPAYTDAQYYRGLALFDQKAFGGAVPPLLAAADAPDYLYAEQAEWYLTLAYLQLNRMESCKARARRIAADTGHYRRQQAGQLLKRLAGGR
jgi:tetratricopeptide (TPR) repeat protein